MPITQFLFGAAVVLVNIVAAIKSVWWLIDRPATKLGLAVLVGGAFRRRKTNPV
ncbi:MAG: hypothetical protein WDN31_06885 [Hyphomicrobium sp.]